MGLIYPGTNVVHSSKLVRIQTKNLPGDTIKLRLTCLTGVWELDGIFMDYTSTEKFNEINLPIVEDINSKNEKINS